MKDPNNNDAPELNQEHTPEASQKDKEKVKKEKRKKNLYKVIALILIAVIIVLLLLLVRQCSADRPILNPDYPPQETDPNATPIEGDDDTKLEHEEGGGAVSLQFMDVVTIDLSDKMAYLSFANPGRSTQDMMLQIIIQDRVIAQSARLLPGYEIAKLELLDGAEKMLTEGVYQGKFTVYYYDPETNERAMVNTDAPVTITVKN